MRSIRSTGMPWMGLTAASMLVLVLAPGVLAADPSAAPSGTWFDELDAGVCYELTADAQGTVDFTAPPTIVDCAQPHSNEVVALLDLGGPGDPLPADVDTRAIEGCDALVDRFLGRPVGETQLWPFATWPDERDWAAGVRQARCSVVGSGLVGTSASGSLRAEGETLAAWWQPADVSELWLVDGGTGEPVRLLTDGFINGLLGPASWTADGVGMAIAGRVAEDDTDVFLVATDGSGVQPLVTGPRRQEGAAFSPDGERVAYISSEDREEYDIFVRDLDGTTGTPITDHPQRDATPRWSPDGASILFRRVTDGLSEIWVMAADGSDPRRLIDNGVDSYDPRWSPDGSTILYTTALAGSMDIWIADADGSDARQLTDHPGAEEYPTWSKDGRVIAFQSDRHGTPSIWLMLPDGSDASLLTAVTPIGYPAFAPVEIVAAEG